MSVVVAAGGRATRACLAVLLVAAAQLGAWPVCRAAEPAPTSPAKHPRIALVLSGGGARGGAHIGVLKVLDELRIPVDLIVGTSMGAVIGGLYATGWKPDEIENLLAETDWGRVFVDAPYREEKPFRRKQDDVDFLIPTKMRFRGWRPYIPPGLVGGQRMQTLFETLAMRSTGRDDFDEFPIPFRAVAADLLTGEAVVLNKGSLATAMRASLAIPGVFPPVEMDGRTLVDGGAVANLPIGIARELGAQTIIAVDVTSALYGREELQSMVSIVSQVTGFLTSDNRREDLKKLRPSDLLLSPELDSIGVNDFHRVLETVPAGDTAARAASARLQALAVSAERYAAFQARRHREPVEGEPVRTLVLENTGRVVDEIVHRRLRVATGRPLDASILAEDILQLSSLEYFGLIQSEALRHDGATDLRISTPPKPYERDSLQFGFSVEDDFQGETSYGLALRHQFLAANRHGGEWQNIGQIGDTALLLTEFYQPLDNGMRWFVAPAAGLRRRNQSIWADGRPVAEFRLGTDEARIDIGRVLGNWGEARLGAFFSNNSGDVRIGSEAIPPFHEHDGGVTASFRVDTLDATAFPRHGMEMRASWSGSSEALGADHRLRRAELRAAGAFTFGRHTFYPSLEAASVLEGPVTLRTAFALGGVLRLSGLGKDELIGQRGGVARLVYYRELKRFDLGALSPRMYAGASLEAGNAWLEDEAVTWSSLRRAGSLFVGAQTPIGPLLLAYGVADGGRHRSYLTIGLRF